MASTIMPTESVPETSGVSQIDAKTFQRLHPRAYLERFLAEGIRPDGRTGEGWRDTKINVGSISTADGSALVRMGETTVVCGIKVEIAEPDLDRPDEGFIVPNVDLPALCSPKFKPGPPGEEAQVLSERINNVLLSADVVPLTSLCIYPGKAAFVLYLDMVCINYDGNVMDAALLSAIAALRSASVPKPTYNEDTGKTTCSPTESIPVQVRRLPLSASFGVFDSEHVLCDLTSFEEPLVETSVTVVVDENGDILSATQLGLGSRAGTTSENVLTHCMRIAKARRIQLTEVLQNI